MELATTRIVMPLYRLFAIALFFALTQVGCATRPILVRQPEFSCRNLDWYETGRGAGNTGSANTKLDIWKERCNSTPHPVNEDLYANGYEAGLVEYCSATVGFEAGRNGQIYENVCPQYLETKFLTHFEIGRRVRDLESENMDLETRIDNLTRLMTSGQSGNSMMSQLEHLKRRRISNSGEISLLEGQLPKTSSTRF